MRASPCILPGITKLLVTYKNEAHLPRHLECPIHDRDVQ